MVWFGGGRTDTPSLDPSAGLVRGIVFWKIDDWQLAREIVRMGEVLERQQMTLVQITQHLDWGANRALPPGQNVSPVPYTGMTPAQPPVPDESSLARELGALREELERERELVERLRRSKLEIERRATVAEAELERRAESPDMSALRRFLGKEQR